jgi:uncharacterized membrane protein YkoI
MNKLTTPQWTLAAALLLAAAPLAFATPASGANGAQTEHSAWSKVSAPPQADVAAFEHAKVSLTDAIRTAQQQEKGKTLEARFEMWQGKPAYLVRTCSKGQVWEGRIDANSGRLLGQPHTMSEDKAGSWLKNDMSALRTAQTSLTQAVSQAEHKDGGKVIMARVKAGANGVATYDLDLVKHGQLRTAMVNAENGRLG